MKIVLVAAALLLGACTATPKPVSDLGAGTAKVRSIEMYGTLAAVNSIEWKAAPAFTRLTALRARAAKRLTESRIDVATAREVQRRADAARRMLDQALTDPARADELITGAARAIDGAETFLEGAMR